MTPHQIFVELVVRRWWKNAYLRALATVLKKEGRIEWYYTDFTNEDKFLEELKKVTR